MLYSRFYFKPLERKFSRRLAPKEYQSQVDLTYHKLPESYSIKTSVEFEYEFATIGLQYVMLGNVEPIIKRYFHALKGKKCFSMLEWMNNSSQTAQHDYTTLHTNSCWCTCSMLGYWPTCAYRQRNLLRIGRTTTTKLQCMVGVSKLASHSIPLLSFICKTALKSFCSFKCKLQALCSVLPK